MWPYNSISAGLVLLAPAAMTRKSELHRFTRATLAMGLLANVCFLLWPTTCKRPVLEEAHAAYEFLVSIDAPLHACPSLHAGFSVLSALCLAAVMRQSWNRVWSFVVWLWVGVILYADAQQAARHHRSSGGKCAGCPFLLVCLPPRLPGGSGIFLHSRQTWIVIVWQRSTRQRETAKSGWRDDTGSRKSDWTAFSSGPLQEGFLCWFRLHHCLERLRGGGANEWLRVIQAAGERLGGERRPCPRQDSPRSPNSGLTDF